MTTHYETILITGGSGFIGSHLADTLLEQGYHVINLDNFNDFYNPAIKRQNIQSALSHGNYTLVKGDILDRDCLNALPEFDCLIHLAARAGVRPSIDDPLLYQKVNIEGTLNLLELARERQVTRVLCASSSSVYGNNKTVPFSETDNVDTPVSPYAATKKACELICYNYHHLYNIDMACLRFFTVYGPRQRPEMAIHKFSKMIMDGQELPVFNDGQCLRDYTYIDDIIHGVIQILQSKTLTYDVVNLGESQTISTLDLITLLESKLGKKAILNLLPAQPGDVDQTFANIDHARARYNYNPQFPIEKGIEAFVEWFLSAQ